MCIGGLLKSRRLVNVPNERNLVTSSELKSLLIELSREKENMLTMEEEQKETIKFLLLMIRKLEEVARCSIIGDENSSKVSNGLKIRVKKEMTNYGDKVLSQEEPYSIYVHFASR